MAIFVAALIAVILALGMTALDESVTIPEMVPSPAVCAITLWAGQLRQINSPSTSVAALAQLPLRANRVMNVIICPLG